MEFFYPNYGNDMWRIWGLIAFGDKDYFVDLQQKVFRKEVIIDFLRSRGIALYDTACAVIRTKNTASDKDLQVVEETDLDALLCHLPHCQAVVTTGQKATDIVSARFSIPQQPAVGSFVTFTRQQRTLRFYRMPSSSRAYPLALEAKAAKYTALLPLLKDIQG